MVPHGQPEVRAFSRTSEVPSYARDPTAQTPLMKFLITLLIGLLAGAILALFAANLLARKDASGRAVMVLMQDHLFALRAAIRVNQCPAEATAKRLARLAVLAAEIDYAFASGAADEPEFRVRSAELTGVLAGLERRTPQDCASLTAALKSITDTCDACHHAYRH